MSLYILLLTVWTGQLRLSQSKKMSTAFSASQPVKLYSPVNSETKSPKVFTGCLRCDQWDDGKLGSVVAVPVGTPAVGHPCAGPGFTFASLL